MVWNSYARRRQHKAWRLRNVLGGTRRAAAAALAIAGVMACSLWAGSFTGIEPGVTYVHREGNANRWFVQLHGERTGVHGMIVRGAASGPGRIRAGPLVSARAYVGETRSELLGFSIVWRTAAKHDRDYLQDPFIAVVVPYWFLVLFMAGIPVLWVYRRRRPQFQGFPIAANGYRRGGNETGGTEKVSGNGNGVRNL
jgi:hypothetical protein